MFWKVCGRWSQKFLKAAPDEKSTLFPKVSELWRQFTDVNKVCKPTAIITAIDHILTTGDIWRILYELLSLLFKAGKLAVKS